MLRALGVVVAALMILAPPARAHNPAPTLPDGCHALRRNVSAVTPTLPSNYKPWREVSKYDIVCYGDVINITEPLRSFGGDIIIFADVVKVSQSIDSRVHVDLREFDPYQAARQYRGQVVSQSVPFGTKYIASYNEYYTKCVDCFEGAQGGALFVPRMPDGLVAAQFDYGSLHESYFSYFQSIPAPDAEVLRDELRSGDIRVYARILTISEEFPGARNLQIDCPIAMVDQRTVFAFNAGGLYGGRGGAGSPALCSGDCAFTEGQTRTGQTAQPSRGGDAGNVFIDLTAPIDSPADLERLKLLTNVQGGRAQDSGRYFAPRHPDLPRNLADNQATGSICDFFKKSDGSANSAQEGGNNGLSVTANVSKRESVDGFLSSVMNKEAVGGYDYSDFSKIDVARQVVAVDFFDYIANQNADALSRAQDHVVEDIGQYIIRGSYAPKPYMAEIYQGITLETLALQRLPYRLRATFLEMTKYNGATDSPLREFSRKTGGLFNPADPAPGVAFYNLALLGRLDDVSVQLGSIQNTLSSMDNVLTTMLHDSRETTLKAQIQAVRAKAEQLQQSARDAAPGGSVFNSAVASAGAKIISGAGQLYAGSYTGLIDLGLGFKGLNDAFADPGFGPEIARVEGQYRELLLALDELNASFARERNRISEDALFAAAGAKNARISGLAIRQANLFLFEDYLKKTVINYFNNTSPSITDLQSNINALHQLVDISPGARDGTFRLREIPAGDCLAGQPRFGTSWCVTVPASTSETLVLHRHLSDQGSPLVLYTVAPETQALSLPTYGVETELAH